MSAILEPLFRKAYMLAGNAIVTVVSQATGTRYTYRISAKKSVKEGDDTVHFVSLLNGPENTRDYQFLGTIFAGKRFFHGKKSPIGEDAPSAKAFAWLWRNLDSDKAEVWHSGKCGRCGRLLTDPESIERGLGPKCAGAR
jgi:hypothetical protein